MGAFRTTEGVPDHKKPSYWAEAVAGAFPGAEVSVLDGDHRNTLWTSRLGPARAVTLEGARMRVRWPAFSLTSDGEQSLVLVTPVEGTVVVDQGDGAARTGPGAIALCDLARPTRIDFPAGHQVRCLVVPRWLLGLTEADLRRLTAAPIQPDTTPGRLLSPMLAQLVATAPTLCPGTGEALVRHVVDLISVLALEELQGETDDVPDTVRYLLPRILEHIDRRLDDPDLSLGSIAQAHAISVRYLHRVFEHADTTVRRWVQRRRLQECRRDLARRQAAGEAPPVPLTSAAPSGPRTACPRPNGGASPSMVSARPCRGARRSPAKPWSACCPTPPLPVRPAGARAPRRPEPYGTADSPRRAVPDAAPSMNGAGRGLAVPVPTLSSRPPHRGVRPRRR
jgi:AraC-like DNA-binding protein